MVKDEPSTLSDRDALRLDIVDDGAGLDALEDDWRALSARACNASVFLSWPWHRTWWDVFGTPGTRLHVLTVRDGTRLVGLLPLYRSGVGRFATLRLLGTGERHDDEVVTEYGDVLASERDAVRVGDAVVRHLASFARWRRVVLPCLLEDAVLVRAVRRRASLERVERAAGLRYRVRLDDGEAGHLARLGASRARRVARARRALARDGGLDVEPLGDVRELDGAFRDLAELNHERQTSLGRKSAFASVRFRRFHRALGERLHPVGAFDIVRFRLGHRLLAALYCLDDASGRHYYQSGFATREANRFMPLTAAHLVEMQRAREAGHRWYDLMRGRPPCYKDAFGCETTPMLDLILYRTGAARGAAARGHALRRRLRALLDGAVAVRRRDR